MRAVRGLTMLAALIPSAAQAECQITKFLEIPVTMRGDRAIVSAKINGQDAQFILDSGAFFSTLSRASAAAYGLKLEPLPPNFRLMGINGATSASMTTVQSFSLGGATLPKIDFIVGGTDTGQVGLLGQNSSGSRTSNMIWGTGKLRCCGRADVRSAICPTGRGLDQCQCCRSKRGRLARQRPLPP